MKYIYLFVSFLIGVSSSAVIDNAELKRINGENGWYVPQVDGSFQWIDQQSYEEFADLAELEETTNTNVRIDLNLVEFYLHTRSNPLNPQLISNTFKSISKSFFNASNPTRFIIHGWLQSDGSGMNERISKAWLKKEDCNIIVVRWARAHGEYILALNVLPKVGKKIAEIIDYMHDKFELSLNTLELVGHSLGAHVAGFTAKNLKSGQIFKIVGLDAAMPLISYKNTNNRLESGDALYVETIHTNGGKLGFLKPIGKASFYVNGGESQPGCILDVTGFCSHERSITYYVESVEQNNYPSSMCSTYKDATKNKCASNYSKMTKMNSQTNYLFANGIFYVPVNKKSPHGKGTPTL